MKPGTVPHAAKFDTTSEANLIQVKTEKQRLKSGIIVHSTIFLLQIHGYSTNHRKLHFKPIKRFLGLMVMSSAPLVHNGKKLGVLSNRLPSRASWEILYKVETGCDIAPTPQGTTQTKQRCVSPIPWQAPVTKATEPTEPPRKKIADIPDTRRKKFTKSVVKDSTTQVLQPLAQKHKSTVKRKASPRITVHDISGSPLQKRAKPADFTYTSVVVTNKDNVLFTRNRQNKFWFPGCHIRRGESPGKAAMRALSSKAIRDYAGSLKLKFVSALELGDCICAVYHLQVFDQSTIKIQKEKAASSNHAWCAEWFSIKSFLKEMTIHSSLIFKYRNVATMRETIMKNLSLIHI